MVSLTHWTRVWVNSGSWWRTGKPGVLQFMGLQRVGHNWATKLNWDICSGIVGSCVSFIFSFFKGPPYCSPKLLHQFTVPQILQEGSLFSILSPTFISCRLFDNGHYDWCEVAIPCILIFISLIINDDVHLSMLSIWMSFLKKYLFWTTPHFFHWHLIFLYWVIWAICIFWELIPYQSHHLQIFSSSL